MEILSEPPKLLNALKFKPLKYFTGLLPRVLTFGKMGAGKSSSCNYIIKESIKDISLFKDTAKFKSGWFPFRTSTKAVTQVIDYAASDTLTIIDTCGFADSDRDDDNNMEDIFQWLQAINEQKSY